MKGQFDFRRTAKSVKLDFWGYSSRERVPAKVKNKVRERAGNKCEVCHKRFPTLEFHHKNMKKVIIGFLIFNYFVLIITD